MVTEKIDRRDLRQETGIDFTDAFQAPRNCSQSTVFNHRLCLMDLFFSHHAVMENFSSESVPE